MHICHLFTNVRQSKEYKNTTEARLGGIIKHRAQLTGKHRARLAGKHKARLAGLSN